jgi:hypothetical protein
MSDALTAHSRGYRDARRRALPGDHLGRYWGPSSNTTKTTTARSEVEIRRISEPRSVLGPQRVRPRGHPKQVEVVPAEEPDVVDAERPPHAFRRSGA